MTGAYILFTIVLGITLFRLYNRAMNLSSDYKPQQEDITFRAFFDALKLSNEVLNTTRRERIKRACDPRSVPVNLILAINPKPTPLPDLPFEDPTTQIRTVVQIEGDDESAEEELQTYIASILGEESTWEEAGSDESTFFSSARTFEEEDELEEWALMLAPTEPAWTLEGGLS
jgi:hypothetical protein